MIINAIAIIYLWNIIANRVKILFAQNVYMNIAVVDMVISIEELIYKTRIEFE